jgi:hypothetical protein
MEDRSLLFAPSQSLCDTVKNELRARNKQNQFTPQTNMVQSNQRAKNRLFTVKGKRYIDIKNVKPSQENRVQVLPWKDPNIPLEVTNKIFEYLTWKRVNKFKEVLTTAKTYIKQNKDHLCFKSTMEHLNEITKQINGKENKNEKMFRLKNRVKFRVTGEA